MFYTYILYSEKLNKYYIGSTNNVNQRLINHNQGMSDFTNKGIPWILKYYEVFDSRQEAVNREKQIKKKKSRIYIQYLISMNTPDS